MTPMHPPCRPLCINPPQPPSLRFATNTPHAALITIPMPLTLIGAILRKLRPGTLMFLYRKGRRIRKYSSCLPGCLTVCVRIIV